MDAHCGAARCAGECEWVAAGSRRLSPQFHDRLRACAAAGDRALRAAAEPPAVCAPNVTTGRAEGGGGAPPTSARPPALAVAPDAGSCASKKLSATVAESGPVVPPTAIETEPTPSGASPKT
jgi:hypothetical protein